MCLHIISDYCFVGLLGLLVVVYLLLVGTVAGLVGELLLLGVTTVLILGLFVLLSLLLMVGGVVLMVADFGLWFVDCLSLGLGVAVVCLLAVVVVALLGFANGCFDVVAGCIVCF